MTSIQPRHRSLFHSRCVFQYNKREPPRHHRDQDPEDREKLNARTTESFSSIAIREARRIGNVRFRTPRDDERCSRRDTRSSDWTSRRCSMLRPRMVADRRSCTRNLRRYRNAPDYRSFRSTYCCSTPRTLTLFRASRAASRDRSSCSSALHAPHDSVARNRSSPSPPSEKESVPCCRTAEQLKIPKGRRLLVEEATVGSRSFEAHRSLEPGPRGKRRSPSETRGALRGGRCRA